MAYITGTRKDGSEYTPEFVASIDKDACIGCGRCYKACGHGCLGMAMEEDEETDTEKYFMQVVNDDSCIGCLACSTACPKGCFTHEKVEV